PAAPRRTLAPRKSAARPIVALALPSRRLAAPRGPEPPRDDSESPGTRAPTASLLVDEAGPLAPGRSRSGATLGYRARTDCGVPALPPGGRRRWLPGAPARTRTTPRCSGRR